MDFFQHQDQARKVTGRLIALFTLAVIAIVTLLNFLAALVLWLINEHTVNQYQNYVHTIGHSESGMPSVQTLLDFITLEQWLGITGGVLMVIGLASAFKWLTLRGGGRVVAESLGGRRLTPDSKDFYERRLLNVVEEMALAAGMPVPPVFVLPENSINAFAAGYQASDAVIGVTRGCMTKLSRDQLQGVIAHEFSHISNGDMRLNIRLMAMLFGILFIALIGRLMLEAGRGASYSREGRKGAVPLFLLGLAMMAIGYIGVFCGNLIKAAVSRQREFLADASAVQFTRNPESIAGALKVIGHGSGSEIRHPERDETAHLFFGQALDFRFSGFRTHPPLEDRIRRIEPRWDGRYLPPETREHAEQVSPEAVPESQDNAKAALLAGVVGSVLAADSSDSGAQMAALKRDAEDVWQARALVVSLLIAPDSRLVHDQQLDLVLQREGAELYRAVLRLLPQIRDLSSARRLTLVQKSVPALKQLSEKQYQSFHALLVQLARADGQIDLFEWCLYRLLLQYLAPHFGTVNPVKAKYGKPEDVADDIAILLSYLAHYGHDNESDAERAFQLSLPNGAFGGLGLTLKPKEAGLKALNLALTRLTQLYPHLKARLLKSMVACAKADHEIRDMEINLIQTIAAILECPVPEAFLKSPEVTKQIGE
ncbi:MAG: M48 family metallopeptidase [Oceanobacter sp.]